MESFCNNYVDAGTIIQKKNINFLEWSIYISNLLTILGLISTRFVVNKHISETAN